MFFGRVFLNGVRLSKRLESHAREAVKSIPEERSPERRCEQSEVTEVTEASSQDPRLRRLEQFLDETRLESPSTIPGEGS